MCLGCLGSLISHSVVFKEKIKNISQRACKTAKYSKGAESKIVNKKIVGKLNVVRYWSMKYDQ